MTQLTVNKFLTLVTFFIISFLIYAFYISQFEFQLFSSKNSKSSFFYDYKLSQNIHTNYSTGSGTVATVIDEAKRTHQDFLMFTDTNIAPSLEIDRYQNQIGLLFGHKIIDETFRTNNYNYDKSSVGAASDLKIESPVIKKGFNLKHLINTDADGLEVINLKQISQTSWEKSKISTIWSILLYPFNPRLSLMRLYSEPTEELRIFDQISQKRNMSMFLGAEVTAKAIPITNLIMKFPSYERVLSVGSQHLLLTSELTGNIQIDKIKIIEALKKGSFYIAFDELGETTGFEIYSEDLKSKKRYFLGDNVTFQKDQKIYYKLPSEPNIFFEVVLYKNGVRLDHLNTFEGSFQIKTPGVYRLQVRLSPKLPLPDAIKWLTWIYTNNFYFH